MTTTHQIMAPRRRHAGSRGAHGLRAKGPSARPGQTGLAQNASSQSRLSRIAELIRPTIE